MLFHPHRQLVSRCGALLLAACAPLSLPARAQTATAPKVATAPQSAAPLQLAPKIARKSLLIRVANVPASLMAWWLDPKNRAEPLQLEKSRSNRENNPLLLDKANPRLELPALPAGIERIVAIDPTNALLVSGTQASLAQLQTIVAGLDKPMPQVEIEFQLVQISAPDAAAFGIREGSEPGTPAGGLIRFVPGAAQKSARFGKVSVNAALTLAQLVAQNKAKILTAPRLIALDRLTADLGAEDGQGVVVDIKTRATPETRPVTLTGEDGQLIMASTRLSFSVTPTIGADDSIKLQLAPARILKLALPQSDAQGRRQHSFPTPSRREVFLRRVLEGALIETTVRDGQTIAVSGFTSRFFNSTLEDNQNPDASALLLVTTRLMRRPVVPTAPGPRTAPKNARPQNAQPPMARLQIAPDQRKRMQQIRVRNVPPSLMANWIDPAHHSVPFQFAASAPFKTPLVSPSALALPAGIDSIVAIDPQNAILVFGTDEGVKEISDTIAFLDRPLRQIELEIRFVQIEPGEIGAFGIETKERDAGKESQIGFVRADYQTTLARLVGEKKAVIISAPRVTAINNLQASVGTFHTLPGTLGLRDETGRFTKILPGADRISIETRVNVTPTINNDNTVTVLMSTSSALKIAGKPGQDQVLSPQKGGLESIFNVRDGDTVALSGFSQPLLPGVEKTAEDQAPNLLIFVTSRIVRRADDDSKAVVPKP